MAGRARSKLAAAARSTSAWGLGRRGARPVTSVARGLHSLLTVGLPDAGHLRELRLVEHGDVASRSGVLEPARPSTVSGPQEWDARAADPVRLPSRPVAWSSLEDVELNDTSLVRAGRSLIGATGVATDVARGLRIKGPGIVGHRGDRVLVACGPPQRTVSEGIRLCGFGSSNWYHWLVEIVPTALLIDELPPDLAGAPLLVPETVGRAAAWREALEVTVPGRAIITVPREGTLAVERMVWIDPAVNGPRTLRDDAPVELDLLVPSLELLARFRATVLERLAIEPSVRPGRRVLLVRPPGAKRSANQDDLIPVARSRGFEPVDPGSLPFAEQVRLFAEAEAVAGGWGAAWSSMLFAAPQTRGLMWAPDAFARWTLFSNLAEVSGMTLHQLLVPVGTASLVPANKAPQHVPPDEFAAALDALL